MRLTERRLRRIIRDVILEKENLNEGFLDFFKSKEYRYIKELSEDIINQLIKYNNITHSRHYKNYGSYGKGIAIEDVNLSIAKSGGPYIEGTLTLVDLGSNKKYFYNVSSNVVEGKNHGGTLDVPLMSIYFKDTANSLDFAVHLYVKGMNRANKSWKDSYNFIREFEKEFDYAFRIKKSRLDSERSKHAHIEKQKKKEMRRKEMGL